MIKVLDPKNDVVFQKLFGMKAHKNILISFLNSILNLNGRNAIKDVEFEFLVNPTGKEIEEFMKTDGEIREAMDVLYKISGDKEAIMLAEMREKAIMDEQSRLNGARKEGIEKEKENSRLRDVERVLKLLTKKFGTLNDVFKEKIKNMGSDNLNLLIENILDIESLEEIEKYLNF